MNTLRLSMAALAVGVAVLVGAAELGRGDLAEAALASAFLFFGGLAAGGVALSAAVKLSEGRWAPGLVAHAERSRRFLTVVVLLAALVGAFAHTLRPELSTAGVGLLTVRLILGAAALMMAAGAFLRRRTRVAAIVYLLAYTVVLSAWAIDLVVAPAGGAPSTILPPLYFMGAFLGGTAAASLAAALGKSLGSADRHDAGKLLFGMACFLAYLVWSAFLPVWYGNLPDETQLLRLRWSGGYRSTAIFMIFAVGIIPFVLLLLEQAKRNARILGATAASILVGLVAEAALFVLPSVEHHGDATVAVVFAGALAALGGLFAMAWHGRGTSDA